MMHRKTTTLIEDPAEWMEAILIALNGDSQVRRETMRRLVEAWEGSGRNVRKMLKADKKLYAELKPYIYGDEHGRPSWRALPFPKGSGLQVMLMPVGPDTPMTRDELLKDEPRLMFMQLLVNPLRDKLSVAPCARCDKYYLKRRANQKVYCGQRCGSITSAKKATRERLATERTEKLGKAQELAQRWATARTDKDWKEWIHTKNQEITPKWLTIAVKNYGLRPPKRKGHHAKSQERP
jgi:hypothetical protein